MDELNAISTEYDYCINQFIEIDTTPIDGIDLGEVDCLTEEDIYANMWLSNGMKFDNLMDYMLYQKFVQPIE